MFKAYKYRIYPTMKQQKLIDQTFGCCRLVYNLALDVKIRAYKEHGVKLSAFDLINQLSEMKRDYKWLQEVDSQALQASVKTIDAAFKNFFRGQGYPKFKSKSGHQSFRCPNGTRKVDFQNRTTSVPKIPRIPSIITRNFEGKIKTITISKTPTDKYFASVMVDMRVKDPQPLPVTKEKTIGIDLGITHFAILSDGSKIDNPRHLQQSLTRLKVLGRRVSRKKKGSQNKKKAVKRLAVIHERVTNQRKDFLQKLSTKLVCDNQATSICVESLAVKNMVKNHKLASVISDAGWSMFVEMLKYKCEWSGKNLIKIGKFQPSTKTCSNCQTINETLTLQDREWTCASCFSTHDRDINAAKNIKSMGLQTRLGKPDEPVELSAIAGAKKQEVIF